MKGALEQPNARPVRHPSPPRTAMRRTLTITLDPAVYDGLHRRVGAGDVSGFIERLVRPHVVDADLDAEYAAMGADAAREADALAWSDALLPDVAGEAAPSR